MYAFLCSFMYRKKDIYQVRKQMAFLRVSTQREYVTIILSRSVQVIVDTIITVMKMHRDWHVFNEAPGQALATEAGPYEEEMVCQHALWYDEGVSDMTPSSSTNHKNFSRPISLELIFKEFYLYSLSSTWLFWWLIPKSMKSFHIQKKRKKVLYEFILRLYIQSLWVKLLSLSQINSMGSLYA